MEFHLRFVEALEQIRKRTANLKKTSVYERPPSPSDVHAGTSRCQCIVEKPPGNLCAQQFLERRQCKVCAPALKCELPRSVTGLQCLLPQPELARGVGFLNECLRLQRTIATQPCVLCSFDCIRFLLLNLKCRTLDYGEIQSCLGRFARVTRNMS